jgi:hypothetical protein
VTGTTFVVFGLAAAGIVAVAFLPGRGPTRAVQIMNKVIAALSIVLVALLALLAWIAYRFIDALPW